MLLLHELLLNELELMDSSSIQSPAEKTERRSRSTASRKTDSPSPLGPVFAARWSIVVPAPCPGQGPGRTMPTGRTGRRCPLSAVRCPLSAVRREYFLYVMN